MRHPYKLRLQQMLFQPGESRGRVDLRLEVSGEEVLDSAGIADVVRANHWQLNPFCKAIIRCEKRRLIRSGSLGFEIGLLVLVASLLAVSLCARDVVVGFGSQDLPKETDLLQATFDREFLMCVKQRHLQLGYVIVLLATSVA